MVLKLILQRCVRGDTAKGEWLKILWNCHNPAAGNLRILQLRLFECPYSWAVEGDYAPARQKCVIVEVLQTLPAVSVVQTRRLPATYQLSRFERMQSSPARDVPIH